MAATLPRFSLLPPILITALTVHGARIEDLDLSVRPSDIEPAVTLRENEKRVVQEYRVNDNLYMIKVTPAIGAPYYLVDEDGSGDLAWHRGDSQLEQNVPQWTLFSW